MQTSTERMSYQNPPATDEAIPFGTAITPSANTTTAGQRSKRMIAIGVVSIMVVAGGRTVWRQDIGSSYNHSSGSFTTEEVPGRRGGLDLASRGGLVVATEVVPPKPKDDDQPDDDNLDEKTTCCGCPADKISCSNCCATCDDAKEVGDPILLKFLFLFWPSIYCQSLTLLSHSN